MRSRFCKSCSSCGFSSGDVLDVIPILPVVREAMDSCTMVCSEHSCYTEVGGVSSAVMELDDATDLQLNCGSCSTVAYEAMSCAIVCLL